MDSASSAAAGPHESDLESELNTALAAASSNPDQPYRLDGGECAMTVPMPAGLIDGLDELAVTVRLSAGIVSFISPLASMETPELPDTTATALLRRQFFAAQTDGVGFAVADREDILVAQYHWIPTGLTPEAFSTVFARFVSATIRLRDEVIRMESLGAPLRVL